MVEMVVTTGSYNLQDAEISNQIITTSKLTPRFSYRLDFPPVASSVKALKGKQAQWHRCIKKQNNTQWSAYLRRGP